MPESKSEVLSRGTPVRSDLTREERRDAARRRFHAALDELSDRANPANAVRRNPVAAAGAALGAGFLISSLRARGHRHDRDWRERGSSRRHGGRVEAAADQAATQAATQTSIRTVILGAIGTAVVGALRDRFIKPNIERWTDEAMHRVGLGSQPNDRQPERTVDASGWSNGNRGPGPTR